MIARTTIELFDSRHLSRLTLDIGGLAHATVNGLAINIPAASGATRFGILGKLVQPPRLAKL